MESSKHHMSRRKLLYTSGLGAGAAILTGCSAGGASSSGGQSGSSSDDGGTNAKGSAKKPLEAPKKYSEAPTLEKKVKAGKLPNVEKRLPKNPYVIPHNWVEQGKYGGNMNMAAISSQGAAATNSNINEFFYGISPLRFLNDGSDIGPGTVEKWSANKDQSEWTLHFREGLRWSDGHKFSVDDVLFWWEDLALAQKAGQGPPDWTRSTKGNFAKFKKINSSVLKISYDSPFPLLPGYLAGSAKGFGGLNGPLWALPKHYVKQFHPKYNKKVDKDWDSAGGIWEKKADWFRNPDCPTLIGYRCKSFSSKSGVVLERNPYYYAVTKDGDQLPYIDTISISIVQKTEVLKLQLGQGKIDFCHGKLNQIGLSDVSTLSRKKKKAGIELTRWASGSGSGHSFFLNYDYPDKEIREVFRDPRFRQAISHALNRERTQKNFFYGSGELTTGTLSRQTLEFQGPEGQKKYKEWRDSYVKHDPEKAKKLLAEVGLKDKDGDGYVELPSGKKFKVRIDYPADMPKDAGEFNDQLVADCKKVGLHMTRNSVTPQSYGSKWESGNLMAHAPWDISNTGSMLIEPLFVVPVEASRWAPLQGRFGHLFKEDITRCLEPGTRTRVLTNPTPGRVNRLASSRREPSRSCRRSWMRPKWPRMRQSESRWCGRSPRSTLKRDRSLWDLLRTPRRSWCGRNS